MKIISLLLFATLLFGSKIEFEVLGSGGPEIDGRASTSYLLWIDGRARLMVDMGSGSMLRFEQSHAKLEDLEAVVLTHLHIDHSVDLPAFIKAGYFSSRKQSLDIIGPQGNAYFPSINEFVHILFGEHGAYRYMQDVLTQESDSFTIIPLTVSTSMRKEYGDFSLKMVEVHHGIVPALAVKIIIGQKSIVISGDTNNANHRLEKLAKDADLFVAHHAIPQSTNGYAIQLHMSPAIIGAVAKKAHVKKLLLTHRMNRTIGHERQTLREIKKNYKGRVVFAEDRTKIGLK